MEYFGRVGSERNTPISESGPESSLENARLGSRQRDARLAAFRKEIARPCHITFSGRFATWSRVEGAILEKRPGKKRSEAKVDDFL